MYVQHSPAAGAKKKVLFESGAGSCRIIPDHSMLDLKEVMEARNMSKILADVKTAICALMVVK